MGAHPPPIHAELPADGHGDLLALAPGRLGIGQHLSPFGDRFVIGLKLDQPPGGLHQYGSQARVSVLVNRTLEAALIRRGGRETGQFLILAYQERAGARASVPQIQSCSCTGIKASHYQSTASSPQTPPARYGRHVALSRSAGTYPGQRIRCNPRAPLALFQSAISTPSSTGWPEWVLSMFAPSVAPAELPAIMPQPARVRPPTNICSANSARGRRLREPLGRG